MPAVRLVSGTNVSTTAGRLEVFREWEYGTVCDSSFTDVDARVACRQMGLGKYGAAVPGGILGKGTGKIWMDQVGCNGSEAFLEACPQSGWGVHNCSHAQDVGVYCGPTGAIPSKPTRNLPLRIMLSSYQSHPWLVGIIHVLLQDPGARPRLDTIVSGMRLTCQGPRDRAAEAADFSALLGMKTIVSEEESKSRSLGKRALHSS